MAKTRAKVEVKTFKAFFYISLRFFRLSPTFLLLSIFLCPLTIHTNFRHKAHFLVITPGAFNTRDHWVSYLGGWKRYKMTMRPNRPNRSTLVVHKETNEPTFAGSCPFVTCILPYFHQVPVKDKTEVTQDDNRNEKNWHGWISKCVQCHYNTS